MPLLPNIQPDTLERESTDVFLGYNHRRKIADGEWYFTENLTTAEYPIFAERKRRGRVFSLDAPGGILGKEKLAFVDNGTLYYDDVPTAVKNLSAGEKQLVSMGAYICIFPDNVYYNTADPSDYGKMGARYTSTGEVRYSLCKIDGTEYATPTVSDTAPESPQNAALWIDSSQDKHVLKQWSAATSEWVEIVTVYTKIRFITNGEIPGLFKEYDGVKISGAEADVNGDKVIYAIGGDDEVLDYIVVVGIIDKAVTQSEGYVTLERAIPEMDYVVEAQNRLWGCKYGVVDGETLNEIYCCALGDFKNWRQYMGLSTDSWTASVGSDGAWTGAVNYLGYPMFFKDNRIHRVSISAVGAHQISETVCRGVQKGSSKSLQVVNETLIYKSRSDVCIYQGGFPSGISDALGEEKYSEAAAGTVGDRYYISMKDSMGEWHLFVYDIKHGLWMREDNLHVTGFARIGDELYCATDNALLALLGTEGTKEPYVKWTAESGMLGYWYPDHKYLSRYTFRVWQPEGSEFTMYVEYDSNGVWERAGKVKFQKDAKGKTGSVLVPLRPRRCDHLRIKLEGKGPVRMYNFNRYLSMGSDVR